MLCSVAESTLQTWQKLDIVEISEKGSDCADEKGKEENEKSKDSFAFKNSCSIQHEAALIFDQNKSKSFHSEFLTSELHTFDIELPPEA